MIIGGEQTGGRGSYDALDERNMAHLKYGLGGGGVKIRDQPGARLCTGAVALAAGDRDHPCSQGQGGMKREGGEEAN